MAYQVKANNVKAPRWWGIALQLPNACGAIGVGIHQWLSGIVQAVHNTPTGASTVAWFLTWFWNLPRISNHQNQSVVNAFQYVCFPRQRSCQAWGGCRKRCKAMKTIWDYLISSVNSSRHILSCVLRFYCNITFLRFSTAKVQQSFDLHPLPVRFFFLLKVSLNGN